MLKKSLLSLAITASVAGLSGCNISSVTDNDQATPEAQVAQDAIEAQIDPNIVSPNFNAFTADFPLGHDFFFGAQVSSLYTDAQKDGTAHTSAEGTSSENAVTNAIDDLDGGISTLAPLDITMSGTIDPATVIAGSTVHLVRLPNASHVSSGELILPGTLTAADVDALSLGTLGPFFVLTKADGTEANDIPFAQAAAINFADGIVLPESVGALNLYGMNDGIPGNGDGILAMQPAASNDGDDTNDDYEVSVISVDGTNNVIRISPTTPLAAKSKYIVVVTGGIMTPEKVVDDETIAALPIQASTNYTYITGTEPVFSSGVTGVRDSVNGWEQFAAGILGTAALADGIALTMGYTTVDPQMVLKSMAYPGYWAVDAVVNNDSATGAAILAGAVAAGSLDQATVDFLLAQATGSGLTADQANVAVATSVVSGSITAAYEHPRARAFEIIQGVGATVNAGTPHQLPISVLTAASETPITDNVLISQGAIELPQYNVSFATNPADYWDGSTDVGDALDNSAGNAEGTTPPGDINGDKNVTYRFPFAQEQRKIVAPVLMFEPMANSTGLAAGPAGCVKPASGWPVTIIQHGFTTDRSSHLINGTNIADETCHAVIAMDLAHHGIAAESEVLGLGVDHVATDATTTPFAAAKAQYVASVDASATILDTLAERHENFYMTTAGAVAVMDFGETKAGNSGSLFIRLDNFQRTRDNLRQSTMDLLNLNASLAVIDIDGDGTVPDLDVTNVNYVGHSLGGIVGTSFVAVNNDTTVQSGNTSLPKVQRAVLATPGGSLAKLLENSVGFGPAIIGGLSAAGIEQGTDTFESFLKVFQATVDTADPLNFIADLADGGVSDTPTLITEMVGNIATGGSTPSDLGVPNNADGILIAADTYVLADYTTVQPETARLPMVSTDAMLDLLGAENVLNSPTSDKLVARYTEGGHGTFSSGGLSESATSYDSVPAYEEMLDQTVEFLTLGTVTPVNAGVLSNAAVE